MRTLNTVTFVSPTAFFDIRHHEFPDAAMSDAAARTAPRPFRRGRAGALLASACLSLMLLASVLGHSVPAPAPAAAAALQPTEPARDHAI